MDVELSAKAPGAVIQQGAAHRSDWPSGQGLQRRWAPRQGPSRRIEPPRRPDRVARLAGTTRRLNAAHLNVHNAL
ncbi:Hypothetical protein I596_2243 [Dokdonella koreensis DS-123]|uniref:Uncharacterized protein n=1 Tax=Dokdonella koreensis DS-123 TaxID=1300342 RepID=A0A160DUT4_9GAMM|nr:Hypothetical protein I596_2243 [Dokdonella koreensis DS-123]